MPYVQTEPCRIDNHLGKRCDVLQPHVEALSRDRVNHMRGVADQRQPFADERARDKIPKREGARPVERLDLAEMQPKALLELAMKLILAERDDARGLVALLGPYQRRAFSH